MARVERHDVALAATLHDPTGALARDVGRWLPWLQARYAAVAVATSPPTAPSIVALLGEANVHAGSPRIPDIYRQSARCSVCVHTWTSTWFAGGGRARERRLHVVVSRVCGRRPGHVTSPAAACERQPSTAAPRTGTPVLSHLRRRARSAGRAACGRQWAPAARLARYLECRGLDWETPDRHRRAVRRVGLAEWRRRQETPAEWGLRIDIAATIARGSTRVLARRPVHACPLGRLGRRPSPEVSTNMGLG